MYVIGNINNNLLYIYVHVSLLNLITDNVTMNNIFQLAGNT